MAAARHQIENADIDRVGALQFRRNVADMPFPFGDGRARLGNPRARFARPARAQDRRTMSFRKLDLPAPFAPNIDQCSPRRSCQFDVARAPAGNRRTNRPESMQQQRSRTCARRRAARAELAHASAAACLPSALLALQVPLQPLDGMDSAVGEFEQASRFLAARPSHDARWRPRTGRGGVRVEEWHRCAAGTGRPGRCRTHRAAASPDPAPGRAPAAPAASPRRTSDKNSRARQRP